MSIASAPDVSKVQYVGRGHSEAWHRISFFVALTAAFSDLWFFIETGRLGAGHGLYVTGLQWSPGLAGLVTRYRYEKTLINHGWKWPPLKYQFLGYVVPIAYITPVYATAWIAGVGGFYDGSFLAAEKTAFGWSALPDGIALILYVVFVGTVGMVPSCATALGEEIGWRGFLVPELSRVTGFTNVALISGAAWAVWHYPLLLFGDYHAGTPRVFMMTCFTISVVGLSFLYSWMRLASGSVWTGMLLHASHNLFVESIFDPLHRHGEDTVCHRRVWSGAGRRQWIVAFLCWRRRHDLPGRDEPVQFEA
jgi:membrane protease YdiL (CAAX protease family)